MLERVWVTHSHLDHIVDLAFIVDEYFEKRTKTLKIMALKETIDALKTHVFNNTIWPDFSTIPLANGNMALSYEAVALGTPYNLGDGQEIQAFLGDHTVASIGYVVSEGNNAVLIASDTHALGHVVSLVDKDTNISTLVIECSFPSSMLELARVSKHLTPSLLFEGMKPLEDKGLKLYVNHIKPSYKKEIIREIEIRKGKWDVSILEEGERIDF